MKFFGKETFYFNYQIINARLHGIKSAILLVFFPNYYQSNNFVMNIRTFILFALGICLFSCGDSSKNGDQTEETPSVEITPVSTPSEDMTFMQLQKWEVTDMIFDNDGLGVALDKKPYLIFRDGRASGFAGCNSFVGEYVEGENNGLNFNNLGYTKKACPEAARIEDRFLKLMETAQSFELNANKDKLKIKSTNGQIHLVLK
ncbi:MAG: META domain-containing protein [Bacteroidetes bacterium]|nr:MAG: META domain-containing protein [Bacteroidota bacterium]